MQVTEDLPMVTLAIAVLNEATTIVAGVQSVLAQDYPADRLEVLVYDGGSTDGTPAIASRVLAARRLAAVRDNPSRIQAAAWNRGIDEAQGEILGIMSGHAELDGSYVRSAVEALRRTGADMVGGPVRAIGEGRVAESIALATSSAFGAGGARFRLASREEQVDTVFMGVARTATYRRFRFDEEMVRNQDDELSYRMLDAGCRIVCDPAIGSSYRSRATLSGLVRQYWAYGYWKVRVLQKHPSQVRRRHLIPPAFVLAILGALAMLPLGGWPGFGGGLVLATYAVADAAASVAAGRRHPSAIPILPFVYLALHVSYGSGFLAGLVRFRGHWPRGAIGRLVTAVTGRATR